MGDKLNNGDSAIADFLLWMRVEKGRADTTLVAYERDLKKFSDWVNRCKLSIETLGETEVVRFLRGLQDIGYSDATVTRTMVSVRSLYMFMVIEGLRNDNPSKNVELPRVPKGLPKAISVEEVNELLSCLLYTSPSPRD